MVDFAGSCIAKAANSGTLTVGIRLSPTTPEEIIQQIRALVVDSASDKEIPIDQQAAVDGIVRIKAAARSTSSASVNLVKLIPVDAATSKDSSWLRLIDIASISYVVTIVVGTVQLLIWLQPHIEEIREAVTGLTVPFEQLVERVTKSLSEEQPQPTPKNEPPEKSGNPPAISSQGD
jgi:hypothetical protein